MIKKLLFWLKWKPIEKGNNYIRYKHRWVKNRYYFVATIHPIDLTSEMFTKSTIIRTKLK